MIASPDTPDQEWARVLGLRLEAFGDDVPVQDYARCRTYVPDGDVVPFTAAPTLRDLRERRERARAVLDDVAELVETFR